MTTKNRFRPTRRAVALEPRLLFDGAGAVAAFDAAVDGAEHKGQEAQPKAAAPAAYQAPNIFANARFGANIPSPVDNGAAETYDLRIITGQQGLELGEANVTVPDGKGILVGENTGDGGGVPV